MDEKTGTYRWDPASGQVVKISDHIPVLKKIPGWAHDMNPQEEQRRVLANMTSEEIRREEQSI